jgi:hypothetical protein
VALPESGVLLLVGPNNAGKSATLRDLVAQITVPPQNRPPTRVVTRLELARDGTTDDFQAWLQANAFSVERPDGAGNKTLHYQRPNANQAWNALRNEWESASPSFPQAAPYFVFYASAEQRLGMVGEAGTYDPHDRCTGSAAPSAVC